MIRMNMKTSLLAASLLAVSLAWGGATRAEVLWTRTICAEEGRYIGWPTVCRLKNGDVLAVFSGDRGHHICPWGKVQMVRSRDDGETWGPPVTVVDTICDDRDAGIVQLPNGDVVVAWFTSKAWMEDWVPTFSWYGFSAAQQEAIRNWKATLDPKVHESLIGSWLVRSPDNGYTWERPVKLRDYYQSPHGPILLRDGSLLEIGNLIAEDKSAKIGVSKSTDGGRTWRLLQEEIPAENGAEKLPDTFYEPHVAELPDGTLVGLVRSHLDDGKPSVKGHGYLRITFSRDGGRTWTPMAKTPMLGYPAHLLVLPDGRLLSVYSRRIAPPGWGEFACVSEDGGKTWDAENEIVLTAASSNDLGYPSSCLLSNGDLLTVYYQRPEPNVLPVLMATKWRLAPRTSAAGK